nr:zygote arrest protein 2.L-like isoform X1 [Nerophis lumbriciformis]
MKGFLSTFPTCGVCGSLLCPPPPPPPAPPAKREDRFVTPHMLTYLELCKARVGAGTRERGVQVSAKVDRMVQCSLGPMTLRGEGEGPPPPAQVSGLRFTRPVSTSSLLLERRFPAKSSKQEAGHEDQGEDQGEDQEECGEEAHIQPCRGSNFQFLQQRYGFFHCKTCNIRWESAYVWCISGTNKVYYKQLCRKCQVGFHPYRVESIICKGCGQTCCSCEKKQRHINMKRPHRQDLCCRCRGMRVSCDMTYTFNYLL